MTRSADTSTDSPLAPAICRTADTSLGRAQEVDHALAVHDFGTGGQCRVTEHPVQNGPARTIQGVDTRLRLDGDFDGLFAVVESGLSNGGRSRRADCIQHAPAVQSQYAAAHERVR